MANAPLTPAQKEAFKKRMFESMQGIASEHKEEEEKAAAKARSAFDGIAAEVAGTNQQMFSDLFFDPAEIGAPDFPVDTFFHLHEGWPEEVAADVPERDTNYVWNKDVTYAYVRSPDEHAFLVGLPGSGKTTLPKEVCAVIGMPMFKQSFTEDLEADEFIMSKEIDSSGTHWNVLPFVKSMDYPYTVVLDEFNRLRRGGRLLMNRLLDEGGTLQLRDGREVTPHEQWRAVATDNTRGMGDGLDMFAGDVSDISTTDRFGLMLEVGYLPHDEQLKLLKAWQPLLDDKMADDIVLFGEKVVEGFKVGTFPLPWTPRRMAKAAKMAVRYRNPVKGLQLAYYNFLAEDDERGAANQLLRDIGMTTAFGEFA